MIYLNLRDFFFDPEFYFFLLEKIQCILAVTNQNISAQINTSQIKLGTPALSTILINKLTNSNNIR